MQRGHSKGPGLMGSSCAADFDCGAQAGEKWRFEPSYAGLYSLPKLALAEPRPVPQKASQQPWSSHTLNQRDAPATAWGSAPWCAFRPAPLRLLLHCRCRRPSRADAAGTWCRTARTARFRTPPSSRRRRSSAGCGCSSARGTWCSLCFFQCCQACAVEEAWCTPMQNKLRIVKLGFGTENCP